MALRHTSFAAPATAGSPEDAVLDATRRLVLAHGMQRTTLTEIAQEAGVSRMTVYRRWDGLSQVLGAMMQREWDRLLDLDPASLAARAEQAASVREFLIDEVLAGVDAMRRSELLASLLTHDPELLLPYLVERLGSMHRLMREVFAEAIRRGQAEGSIRAGDPERMAVAVVLAAQSFITSVRAGGSGHDPTALDGELLAMLDAYLRPASVQPS